MKLILLIFISIEIVFGGKCPPNQIITPCTCHAQVGKLSEFLINN